MRSWFLIRLIFCNGIVAKSVKGILVAFFKHADEHVLWDNHFTAIKDSQTGAYVLPG